MEALLEKHRPPPQTETVTQTQDQDVQTAEKAGGAAEPGWSFITADKGGGGGGAGPKVSAASTQPLGDKRQSNEHGNNTDQGDGGGASGFGAPNPMDAFAEQDASQ